jgi:hypothetical protein
MCAVIRLLLAKSTSAAEIHHELCVVYCQIIMSERTVRQWCRMLRNEQSNVHDEKQSAQPCVVSDDLFSVDQKICERQCFTNSEPLCEFSQISRTVLYKIIIVRFFNIITFFLIACFVNSSPEVTFRTSLVLCTRNYTAYTM